MRINRYLALATGISRRAADRAISDGVVLLNGAVAAVGGNVSASDTVTYNGEIVSANLISQTIMLNKPVGYVCSRAGQGNKTVYELLPPNMHHLKPVGRLDKDSSGLLLLTNDGQLAHKLTHPSFQKAKVYKVTLSRHLAKTDEQTIENGIQIDDGLSRLRLSGNEDEWDVTMGEGRKRQIRRTFAKLGYNVTRLHRVAFGPHQLGDLQSGKYRLL